MLPQALGMQVREIRTCSIRLFTYETFEMCEIISFIYVCIKVIVVRLRCCRFEYQKNSCKVHNETISYFF